MQRQGSFAEAAYAGKKKQTRRDRFLAGRDVAVPCSRLVERLGPLYPKGERGRPPIPPEGMLRVCFVQQWYGLSDEGGEDAPYDSQALRRFAGIELNRDAVPDATAVLHFRHWLESHDLSQALFDEVGAMLEERGLPMRQGTIVDATIIAAPPSTRNKQKARDPGMHQTRKGNQWHFGMKAHIGGDVVSGLVRTVAGTAANKADITRTAALLRGEEEAVFGDAGCSGADKRPNSRIVRSPGTSRSGAASSKLYPEQYGIWRSRSSGRSQGRAVVEHPFHIVKNRFRHKRLRHRGLKKNTAQLHTLFALANLVIVKQALPARPGG